MNYLELAQRLRRKCRVAGSGPSGLTGQNEEYSRLLDFVNEAWMEIQRARDDWNFMRASACCQTVAGQTTYSDSDFGITDLGYWALDFSNGDTFRNYANPGVTITTGSPGTITLAGHGLNDGEAVQFYATGALPTEISTGTRYYVINKTTDTLQISTYGGTAMALSGSPSGVYMSSSGKAFSGARSEIFMNVWSYDDWRDTYLYGAMRSAYTRPIVVAKVPDNTLACGPITSAGYTLVGDYYRVPSEMTAATDEPSLPEQFHMAIVYKAMMYYGASEAAPEVYDDGAAQYKAILAQILRTQTRPMRLAGALA